MDTLVVVKAMDVTGKLIKNASNAITSFVADNLTKTPTDPQPFLLTDIRNIDYYEKDHLRLYFTDTYKNGIYKDFKSLANQTPDIEEFETKFNDKGELKEIKVRNNEKGKSEKIKAKEIYAIITDGSLYISTGKNYLPVFKENDDFKFVNDGNIKMNTGAYIGAGVAAGLMAGLFGAAVVPVITSGPEKVVMTIDHLSGEFIVVQKENEGNKEP